QASTADVVHPDIAHADPRVPAHGQECQRGKQLAHWQGPHSEGEQPLPGMEVHVRSEQVSQEQDQRVDNHDDGCHALDDEIECTVVRADNQTSGTDIFLCSHYQTSKSLRAKMKVSARLMPSTMTPERCDGSRSLP